MPEFLALPVDLNRLLPRASDLLGSALVRPESRQVSQEGTPWLTDYAAFLHEQQDNYCQGA
jgi:hypothetical protein